MATQIQVRRDTAANWTSSNPVLAQGEQGLETDTGKVKFGDGTSAWSALGYSGSGTLGIDEVLTNDNSATQPYLMDSGASIIDAHGNAISPAPGAGQNGSIAGFDIDDARIGATTPLDGTFTTLTATGAFTSRGIDDNATSTAVTLDSSGGVGIGTDTPSVTGIHIRKAENALLRLDSTTSKANLLMNDDAGSTRIQNDGGAFAVATGQADLSGLSEKFRIDSSGNVGVGTNNPNALSSYRTLEIQGGADVGGAIRLTTTEGEGAQLFNFNSALYAGGYATTILGVGDASIGSNFKNAYIIDTSGLHRWFDPTDGSTERMRIASDGNVGIDAVNPDAKLEVSLADSDTADYFHGGGFRGLRINDTTKSNAGDVTNFTKSSGSGEYTFNNTSGELMRIDSSGNVGIGAASPNQKLTLGSDSQTAGQYVALNNIATNYTASEWGGFVVDSSDTSGGGAGTKGSIRALSIGNTGGRVAWQFNISDGISNDVTAVTVKSTGALNLEPRASAPLSPVAGDLYFDSTLNKLRCYDGTAWQNCF